MVRAGSRFGRERCPTCFKQFLTSSGVIRHCKQAKSVCGRAYRRGISTDITFHDEIAEDDGEVQPDGIEHGSRAVLQNPVRREHKKVHWEMLRGAEEDIDLPAFDNEEDIRRDDGENRALTPEQPTDELVVDYFPGAAKVYGVGQHLFQDFPLRSNPYSPFVSKSEWELARWLMTSGLTVSSMTEYLHLEHVCL